MKIGYARVSSRDQNEGRQIEQFIKIGIDERYIFVDKGTGANFERPQYKLMKALIREGDTIYLDEFDRLGRDYEEVIKEWKYITKDLKADIVCIENEGIFDSRKFKSMGDVGKLLEDMFLSVFAHVAEQERKKNKKRQREGIDLAKAKGTKLGRPKVEIPDDFENVYKKWKSGEITAVGAFNSLGLSKSTFYNIVKKHERMKGVDSKDGRKEN